MIIVRLNKLIKLWVLTLFKILMIHISFLRYKIVLKLRLNSFNNYQEFTMGKKCKILKKDYWTNQNLLWKIIM